MLLAIAVSLAQASAASGFVNSSTYATKSCRPLESAARSMAASTSSSWSPSAPTVSTTGLEPNCTGSSAHAADTVPIVSIAPAMIPRTADLRRTDAMHQCLSPVPADHPESMGESDAASTATGWTRGERRAFRRSADRHRHERRGRQQHHALGRGGERHGRAQGVRAGRERRQVGRKSGAVIVGRGAAERRERAGEGDDFSRLQCDVHRAGLRRAARVPGHDVRRPRR